MASFIGKILAYITPAILTWLYAKIQEWMAARAEREKQKKETQAVREGAEQAKTPQERENSAKDTIGNF